MTQPLTPTTVHTKLYLDLAHFSSKIVSILSRGVCTKPLWRPGCGVELETTTTPPACGNDSRDACRRPLTPTLMTRPRWPPPTRQQRGGTGNHTRTSHHRQREEDAGQREPGVPRGSSGVLRSGFRLSSVFRVAACSRGASRSRTPRSSRRPLPRVLPPRPWRASAPFFVPFAWPRPRCVRCCPRPVRLEPRFLPNLSLCGLLVSVT